MHNLLIRGGLRAYALTISLLGFKWTWYEIKSKDMNEKGKDFIFCNKSYMLQQAFMVHFTWPWCVHSDPTPTLALDLHAHTVVLPAAAWAGVEGCMYSNIIFSFPLNE